LGVVAALALVAAGCGDDESSSGRQTLTWFIFNEPSGGPTKAAERCSEQSNGRYRIQFDYLPSDADQQREQLVRRLGAEDESIDLIGMDIIWTGEFANARWIEPVPQDIEGRVTENVFQSVLDTAKFEDRLFAVPIWSNTQLLWYRGDKVDSPPETWDDMIDQAEEQNTKIQVQANRYEGLTVLANALIESAGTSFLAGPQEIALEEEPTKRALAVMGRLGNSTAAAANIDTSDEDTARLGFEAGDSNFMVNYPFVYPSAEGNAPEVFENMEAAQYPKVVQGEDSAPPLGGINLGVSAFSKKKDLAFDAVQCLIQAENQLEIAELGGLPPVREDLYDQSEIREIYPGFADVIRDSIADARPRPSEAPAYQDLTLGIQRALHAITDIDPDNTDETYDRLRSFVDQALKREGLL
jgi:multiple sugar transport system substrate-binding protein